MFEGIIFNIQKYSVHDGPGIRTTVFLKGCPLNCIWCHNPESQSFEPELIFFEKKCVGCEACIKECSSHAISMSNGRLKRLEGMCIQCGRCADVCYAGAWEMAGKKMQTTEVLKEIEKDRIFYEDSGGGVTFSGGEPLSQPVFLAGLLEQCRKRDIHSAVDTCGYAKTTDIEKIALLTDLFLYDLKLMDNKKHKLYTGVSNTIILENLRCISQMGKRIFIRIPLIPGINDDDNNLMETADYIKSLQGIEQVNLLPYHNIAKDKYKRLEKQYEMPEVSAPTQAYMEDRAALFTAKGFKVKIGG